MPRGRSAGYDGQREAILERAAELFAARGYPATSMDQVAEASGLSKATLYHYYRDKYSLLVSITEGHVSRLQAVAHEVGDVQGEARMRELILRIIQEYAGAQHAHRVLTEDVRFLEPIDRERVLAKEREVVNAFATALASLRPDLTEAGMTKPLTMLLFGMVNWLFTWMKPDGALSHDAIAPIVADLFLGGVGAVKPLAAAVPAPVSAPLPESPRSIA